MIYFIYGEDSYRSKRKLEEIILGYKEKHKSGLNLIYIDAGEKDFDDFYSNLKINSMFAEKKLIILKGLFSVPGGPSSGWQEAFLENIKNIEGIKDIIVIYEDGEPDKRTKLFKDLQKYAKCQEFELLSPALLKKWVVNEFEKNPSAGSGRAKINNDAVDLLVNFVRSDLWQMANEINKLSNYKRGMVITGEDVALLVKPNIENDFFKTIEAIASRDKKLALSLIHKHLDDGEAPLKILAMVSYQFRTLLIIKDLLAQSEPSSSWQKKSGLHPFVIQKTSYLCRQFTLEKLKNIYWKIFQVDADIKTGKVEPETAIDLLLAEI